MINVRQKGAEGERQVATALNAVVNAVLQRHGRPLPAAPVVQRNQNQSAVGGKDLVGTYGLALEIKRQENLSVNTWWAQCVKSAADLSEQPVLVFRQNNGKWRVMLNGAVQLPPKADGIPWRMVRAEITWDDFLLFFEDHIGRLIALETSEMIQRGELEPA
jgi:hypothetical protein